MVRQTNRIKFKLWHPTGTMEYDGQPQEGLLYGAMALPPDKRKALLDDLEAKHAELTEAGR